jgi:hypothetical protein
MMEKLDQAGEGGGCTPTPFPYTRCLPSLTKLQCTLLLRGQIHSLYFISTLYVLGGREYRTGSLDRTNEWSDEVGVGEDN